MIKNSILFLCAAILLGCTSSGMTSGFDFSSSNRIVYIPKHLDGWATQYLPEVSKILFKFGFTVTDDDDKADFELRFTVDSGITMQADIALMKSNIPVVSAVSSNGGWGTMIANGVAAKGRVEAVLAEFEKALAKSTVR
ncbi:hypothetical protein [Paraglaciecola sp. 25GB23A]|uniref:hypothetical protein n=1 Tax=Paraglaciecola sp. 25GB23A TaxID=3156068 RepID=UPI0032AFE1C4